MRFYKQPDYYDIFPLDESEWVDVRVAVNQTIKDAAAGASFTDYKSGYVAEFSASKDQTLRFNVQLPHGYDEGTDLMPHVHWVKPDANAGTVQWELTYCWANVDDAFPAVTTIDVTDDVTGLAADTQHLSLFPTISGTGKEQSSMLICSITRKGTADTYASSAYLLEFDFHMKMKTVGTRTALPGD
jgi:hypothetical protein